MPERSPVPLLARRLRGVPAGGFVHRAGLLPFDTKTKTADDLTVQGAVPVGSHPLQGFVQVGRQAQAEGPSFFCVAHDYIITQFDYSPEYWYNVSGLDTSRNVWLQGVEVS